ncbi:UbiA family prenyltransferase [Williamwhitmania taraxaci]|uniref:1,4-dihydroxy-2-naphthoate octaprenyltransferase n=1 Tax=Williamwhitmania taraxaci TaxID=1640674 RepID=A0A1G6STR1_9BACT|nr:UbiA family prenyltransferase [Williamwhitmania taraxaci]SDD20004.1 1,4-dihydroxy-2-naphthoate octaprenyltransferase [Williamwhitmania taraxaci]
MAFDYPIVSWFDKNTVKHLRFLFSFFLLPVFLFALSQTNEINWVNTVLAFLILHILVFPSSNGYNSYQDRDEGSIGGLKYPPKVTSNLYYATLLMDILALLAGFLISVYFSLMVLVFILMSRAYSYRLIRLKKYPIIGFLTVFVFQGAFVYLMSSVAISRVNWAELFSENSIICMIISSLFIGSIYPLTQIYQHQADKNDGVISISYKLGYTGTFVFSGLLFAVAVLLMFLYFSIKQQTFALIIFLLMMLPVIYRLSVWFAKVRKDSKHANFENTMNMNMLTSATMNLYFLLLIFNRYGNWF